MPFTLAHPAAVIPIHSHCKRWITLSSLVCGSVVPDAAYFLPLPEHYRANAHAWWGPFSFSLLVGIFVLLLFYLIEPGLIFVLPSPHREAVQSRIDRPRPSLGNALLALLGIVVGEETHVVWDWFTHEVGWRLIPFRFSLGGTIIAPETSLQCLFTVVGVWILLVVYDKWCQSQGFHVWTWHESSWRVLLWIAILLASFVPAMIESHALQAIRSSSLLSDRHFAIILATGFSRNALLACAAVGLGARLIMSRTLHKS